MSKTHPTLRFRLSLSNHQPITQKKPSAYSNAKDGGGSILPAK